MDNRGLLLLALMFCIYTLNVYAKIDLVCKGESLDEDRKFLEHLNMGYKNPESLEVIKKNTLCGIQTICRSIMQVTAPTHGPEIIKDVQTLRDTVESYKKISKDALVIIYNINGGFDSQVLYPLWLFSLYVKNMLKNYFSWLNPKNVKLITKLHEMIIKQLTESMEGCPDHNEFDVTDSSSRFYFEFSVQHDNSNNFKLFSEAVKEHFDRIRPKLMEATGENYKRIDVNNLLDGTISFLEGRHKFKIIKDFYGISITWHDATRAIWNAQWEAKSYENLFNGLQGIKDYRILYLTLMKMAVYRMLWIHFLVVTEDNRLEWNDAMYKMANSFGNMTGLNDDDQAYAEAVKFLHDKRSLSEVSEVAIQHIEKQLEKSCSFFKGSEVSNIVKEDVPKIYIEFGFYKEGEKPPAVIIKNLKIAEWFVNEVADMLRYVDPDFYKSVLEMAYVIPENSDVSENIET